MTPNADRKDASVPRYADIIGTLSPSWTSIRDFMIAHRKVLNEGMTVWSDSHRSSIVDLELDGSLTGINHL